jgi:paired amphipathic helix protein Sin3a
MNNQPMHGVPPYDREREMEEQRRLTLQQQDDIALREREQGERQTRDAFVPAAPHHSNAGSIPIHQPVASRVPGAIHSPGGLLANHGGPVSNLPLGGPASAAAVFGGPLQPDANRVAPPAAQNSTAGPQHQMFGPVPHASAQSNSTLPAPNGPTASFGAPPPQQQQQLQDPARGGPPPSYQQAQPGTASAPAGPGMAQGQQPILNVSFPHKTFSQCQCLLEVPAKQLCPVGRS